MNHKRKAAVLVLLVSVAGMLWGQAEVAARPRQLAYPTDTARAKARGSLLPPSFITSAPSALVEGSGPGFRPFESDCSPQAATGADVCENAMVIPVPVGPAGEPGTVTISGDNTGASGPDCGSLGTVWWEAFSIDQCADVTIDLCCTAPTQRPSYIVITGACPGMSGFCANIFPNAFARGAPVCGDDNVWMTFQTLPAGTYYYPVFSDAENPNFSGFGPYQMHISAEECIGACCHTADGACAENVGQADCSADGNVWTPGISCCETECRPSVPQFDASNVELLSWVSIDQFPGFHHTGNDIMGYVSPSGREYAIIGFTTGAGFVDVTDPRNPVIVGVIDGGGIDQPWRDMSVYHQHAYIVTDGGGVGLQIVDLTAIDNGTITLVNTTDLDSSPPFFTSHSIHLNPSSGYLYLAIPNLNNGLGLTAVSLADPVNPVVAGTWTDTNFGVRCHELHVVTYDEGLYAGREIAFCFAEDDGLRIVDVTNKGNMFKMSSLPYPSAAYTHQGWLTENRRYFVFGDELDEVFGAVPETTSYVVDVQDLNNPIMLPTFSNGLCSIDHNLMIRDGRVFEANYSTGLRVFDFHDVNNVQEIGYFDTHPEDNSQAFVGAWGVYAGFPSGVVVISDIERGLFVLTSVGACCADNVCTNDVAEFDCLAMDGFFRAAPAVCVGDNNGNGVDDTCEECSVNADCGDGLFCNGGETCDAASRCQPGTPPCGAGYACVESTDSCVCAQNSVCDDGLFCNGVEACTNAVCGPGTNPCPGQLCNETTNACVACLTSADCVDNLFCNGIETCGSNGACQAGTPPCPTNPGCDEASDACRCDDDADCGDGLFCNGPEVCGANNACRAGTAPCSANLGCDETQNTCRCVKNEDCVDDLYCNGVERCVTGLCVAGTSPCSANQQCSEQQSKCVECFSGEECDDDDPCTADTCPGGTCAHTLLPACFDGDEDGVFDGDDACPNTASGAVVDADGCSCSQLDEDDDGVNNCADRCVNTRPEDEADDVGCSCRQKDTDNDGVDDCRDLCPITGSGEEVNLAGCADSQLDDDDDGIPKSDDDCPNTPQADLVNSAGCGPSQLDDDADGVSNAVDFCPDTPADAEADADGCADSQLDDDLDGVSNVLDLCPETVVGEAVDADGCSESQLDESAGEPVPGDGTGSGEGGATRQCTLLGMAPLWLTFLGLMAMRGRHRRTRPDHAISAR